MLQKVLFVSDPVLLLTFGDSYRAADISLCGNCKAQRHYGLNEITFSKVSSNQEFPYSPKIPFITTIQRVQGLESFSFVCLIIYH